MVGISNSGKIHSQLAKANKSQGKALNRIASGKKILSGSDDPAGLAVLNSIESQTRGLMKQIGNRQDEISLIQTAEGALSSTSEMLQRINELSIQASNGTLTNSDREMIQLEINQLNQQIDQTANNTQYNTKNLLDGSLDISLQNGNSLAIPSMNAESLGMAAVDVTSQTGASSAIGSIRNAINIVSSQRGTLGAVQNGISSEIEGLRTEMINALEAQSRIGDADIAQELINMSLNELQSKAAIKAFKMNDDARTTVLSLLD